MSKTEYVMPVPKRGQAVIYYPQGIVNDKAGVMAYVNVVSRANVELSVFGLTKEVIPHVSDPLVKENPEYRKSGLWDFCLRDKAIDEKLAELESRLAALEKNQKKTS